MVAGRVVVMSSGRCGATRPPRVREAFSSVRSGAAQSKFAGVREAGHLEIWRVTWLGQCRACDTGGIIR